MDEKMFIVTAVIVRTVEAPDEDAAREIFEEIMEHNAHDEFFADYDLQIESAED